MISVVSQKGNFIVRLDVTNYCCDAYPGYYSIRGDSVTDKSTITLGQYESRERAIEVFNEMVKAEEAQIKGDFKIYLMPER